MTFSKNKGPFLIFSLSSVLTYDLTICTNLCLFQQIRKQTVIFRSMIGLQWRPFAMSSTTPWDSTQAPLSWHIPSETLSWMVNIFVLNFTCIVYIILLKMVGALCPSKFQGCWKRCQLTAFCLALPLLCWPTGPTTFCLALQLLC